MKSPSPFGFHRVLEPEGVFPQAAKRLDTKLPILENEILIDVSFLNIDSASFTQIKNSLGSDKEKIKEYFLQNIKQSGKQHNWVTGSGGMLVGKVSQIGSKFPAQKFNLKVGDNVATLVSLTLTPLIIDSIEDIDLQKDRVICQGKAILFETGNLAVIPIDFSMTTSLALLDICGAPALVSRYVRPGQTVILVGGAGKAGMISALAAAESLQGIGRIVILDPFDTRFAFLKELDSRIECYRVDVENINEVLKLNLQGDIVINVANRPNLEMVSAMLCKERGRVIYFSMATDFTKVALGVEGITKDIELLIGNGYCQGHAEYCFNLIRRWQKVKRYLEMSFG